MAYVHMALNLMELLLMLSILIKNDRDGIALVDCRFSFFGDILIRHDTCANSESQTAFSMPGSVE